MFSLIRTTQPQLEPVQEANTVEDAEAEAEVDKVEEADAEEADDADDEADDADDEGEDGDEDEGEDDADDEGEDEDEEDDEEGEKEDEEDDEDDEEENEEDDETQYADMPPLVSIDYCPCTPTRKTSRACPQLPRRFVVNEILDDGPCSNTRAAKSRRLNSSERAPSHLFFE